MKSYLILPLPSNVFYFPHLLNVTGPERKVSTALDSSNLPLTFSLQKPSWERLWMALPAAVGAMLWMGRHLEGNPEYELHFNGHGDIFYLKWTLYPPWKAANLPQKWSITQIQAGKWESKHCPSKFTSVRYFVGTETGRIMCVLSSNSVVMCFQERQMREHQETYLLLYLLNWRDLFCPCWWKVIQTSHCFSLTDVHG